MRKAGDLIAEYMREKVLAEHRQNPIGRGAYGIVYQSDVPGNVIKQMERPQSNSLDNATLLAEASNQAIAAELGIAPSVAAVETFPGGIGDRIEMSDIRNNFEGHEGDDLGFPVGRDAIRVNQQLGQLALNGVAVEDRHSGNVFYNKMTGRPMQIDFGQSYNLFGDGGKAYGLAEATANGFEAAGMKDIADIYRATVMDLLEGGQDKEAYDVARQGFSRLQKIK
jgi:hypothetical protein